MQLRNDAIPASVLYGNLRPIYISFGIDELPGQTTFKNLKQEHHKKVIKPKNNEIPFSVLDDHRSRFDFHGEVRTLTLQLVGI